MSSSSVQTVSLIGPPIGSFHRCITSFVGCLLRLIDPAVRAVCADFATVGPIPAGINAFDFAAPAPAHDLLPSTASEEILGVTVIIITASYRDKEFVRVGYYVNTYSEDPAYQQEQLPPTVEWDKLMRNVLIEKPKVTR